MRTVKVASKSQPGTYRTVRIKEDYFHIGLPNVKNNLIIKLIILLQGIQMAIKLTAELLNPFTGEVITDPTLEDAHAIYKQINELSRTLTKAKKLAQAFVDKNMVEDDYPFDDGYKFRRVGRRTIQYNIEELQKHMTAELLLQCSQIDGKAVDQYVASGLKTKILTADKASAIMSARNESTKFHIRFEKPKFDKKE